MTIITSTGIITSTENAEDAAVSPVVAAGAEVDPRARIGARTRIWNLAHVREDATIGADCVVGRGAYVGPGVRIGDNCKLQNYALVYEPAVLEDGVFVGPAAVFTNDVFPRAVNPDGSPHATITWVDAADGHVLVNTAEGRVKHRNCAANPRVAITVMKHGDAYDRISITGTVVAVEPGEHAKQGRLADARRPQQADHLAQHGGFARLPGPDNR